jgi:Uma2 family endonuclease
MVTSQRYRYIAPEEYLANEAQSQVKHEYVDGQVYAMAGGSDAHATIALNLASGLRNHIRGTGCRVFMSDMKARIEPLNIFYYPDVMVTCDPRDRELPLFKRHPCLIVEVLSNSTEAFDRGDKFADYQHLESLKEYVLISQKRQRVDCFQRNPEGFWALYFFNPGDTVHLISVDFQISVDALYEDVTFTDAEIEDVD